MNIILRRSSVVAALLVTLVNLGCASLADLIVDALEGLAGRRTVQVRIAGGNYFELDPKDSGDGFSSANGFLSVVHNPGCGIVGNSGEDRFFSSRKPLPLLAKLVRVQFTPCWPNGRSSGSQGGIGGWGSFTINMRGGPSDPDQATFIDWSNACQGSFADKNLYYSVSFVLSVPEGTDLGESTFDPAPQAPPPCPQEGYTSNPQPPTTGVPAPSGFLGVVKICNTTTQRAEGMLRIEGTCPSPLSGAQGIATMKEDIPVVFLPAGSAGSETQFMTQYIYKQGTWQITNAQVLGQTGKLANLPLTLQLPGGVGTPVLDFTGGRCPF